MDSSKKYYLSFHTVFLLNENIKWLEEFIVYYKHIGVDHFYLYDNEDSNGCHGTRTTNKYGFPISTTSTEDDKVRLSHILEKYGDCITYISWQPTENGVVVYGQNESISDCITKYGKDNEWMIFMDLDEFIYSESNVNLVEYLKSLDRNVSAVKLLQKKFLDRFLSKESLVTQEFQCIDLDIGVNWGAKNIVRCDDFISCANIHGHEVKHETLILDKHILRFNHYNLNDKQLNWMKGFYRSDKDFTIDSTDTGMLRYKAIYNIVSPTPVE